MTDELEKKLFEKYPKIFRQKDLPMSQTAMCWGIECGDGLFWLIDQLCASLQWGIDNPPVINGEEISIPQIEAVQVKEKFGGLRFYTNTGTDEQYTVIDFAESLSYHICHECGSTKNVGQTTGSWIITMCKECAERHKTEDWKEYD